MKSLLVDPFPIGYAKVRGEDNKCRVKVGRSYRIVYKIDKKNNLVNFTYAGTKQNAKYRDD